VVREPTDEYLSRQAGFVRFYAAIMQSSHAHNPHGLPHAWAYLAR
jgi:hypothetical protein